MARALKENSRRERLFQSLEVAKEAREQVKREIKTFTYIHVSISRGRCLKENRTKRVSSWSFFHPLQLVNSFRKPSKEVQLVEANQLGKLCVL